MQNPANPNLLNFKLNEDKNILVTVDESGIITILDSKI